MALDCLMKFKGDLMIFVGEEMGGKTASRPFFVELESPRWELRKRVDIPRYSQAQEASGDDRSAASKLARMQGCSLPLRPHIPTPWKSTLTGSFLIP
mmetsp:Transcript_4116/g.15195  ORF Transcript_4116/g.15195 Transcript_4116/m.15195 type:complete len:97 (-) Transcript_4116:114-404(-)